jgi:hypothetical protein
MPESKEHKSDKEKTTDPKCIPPTTPPPDPLPNWHESEKGRAILNFIIAAAIGLIVLCFLILGAQKATEVKYTTERYYLNATLVNNETRWYFDVFFTTDDVFSARTDITVEVYAKPNYTNLEKPHSIFLYMKDATHDPPKFIGREVVTPEFAITQLDANNEFYEKKVIRYQSQGQKYIAISSVQLDRLPHNFDQVLDVIQISSEDSKHEYDTNRSIIALTYVIVGLAVAASYSFVKAFVYSSFDLISLHRKSKKKDDSTY